MPELVDIELAVDCGGCYHLGRLVNGGVLRA